MRFDGETRLFLSHCEFFGEIRAGGGHYNLDLGCACGWTASVAIVDGRGTELVNAAKLTHYKLPAYVHELELDGDDLKRFVGIWGDREEAPAFEITTGEDAIRLLVWCDHRSELGLEGFWLNNFVIRANAALVLLG